MRFFRRRPPATLPENWIEIVEAGVAHWALLDDDEREWLGELMAALIEDKRWEASHGFVLTDEIRTIIAAQASLLILGLDFDWYRAVQAIVVHPSEIVQREPQPGAIEGTMEEGPFSLLGLADHRYGPVLIAWDAARANARHPAWGRDVVFHEFAHKLDMLDDLVDGTPPLPDRTARDRWIEVCTAEYRLLRAGGGGHLLRAYATVNPGEFFAVATEVFFDLPGELLAQKPALYGVLRDFYRQDPAHREQLAATRLGGDPPADAGAGGRP
jgi:MtfA peptidase